jgi:hypothetical protein
MMRFLVQVWDEEAVVHADRRRSGRRHHEAPFFFFYYSVTEAALLGGNGCRRWRGGLLEDHGRRRHASKVHGG